MQTSLVGTLAGLGKETWPPLYRALVHPRMEFTIQAWSCYLKKNIRKLKRVQRCTTKLIPGLAHMSYKDWLTYLNLTTLEERRRRGDLIKVFKIIKGFDKISVDGNFLVPTRQNKAWSLPENKRSQPVAWTLQLVKPQHRPWKQCQSFSTMVVTLWN